MKARIDVDGKLQIEAETSTEEYTLLNWKDKNTIQMDDLKRQETYHYRGTSLFFYRTRQKMATDLKVRDYNIGESNYAEKKIQPWDLWIEYKLNPFDADIVKRILRTKETDSRKLDYEKIIHICKERIRQIDEGIEL